LKRGYNQSHLIAQEVGKIIDTPVKTALIRKKRTIQQARLKRDKRKTNLIGAFSVKRDEIYKNSTILLLDDVITTGTTLAVAANTLLDAGVKKIYIGTLARG
jgi:ComF family protein